MDSEYKDWTKDNFIEYIEDQDRELFDLTAKVIEVINHVGWDVDGTYTFNDGDRWAKFDPIQESIDNE